jgi:hypothetical protein
MPTKNLTFLAVIVTILRLLLTTCVVVCGACWYCQRHGCSFAVNVQVVAELDISLAMHPVGHPTMADVLEAIVTLQIGTYQVANSTLFTVGMGYGIVFSLDIAKNLVIWKM